VDIVIVVPVACVSMSKPEVASFQSFSITGDDDGDDDDDDTRLFRSPFVVIFVVTVVPVLFCVVGFINCKTQYLSLMTCGGNTNAASS
jgi:hypothetical protein